MAEFFDEAKLQWWIGCGQKQFHLVGVLESVEGGEDLGVGFVPAAAAAVQMLGFRFAARLREAASEFQ